MPQTIEEMKASAEDLEEIINAGVMQSATDGMSTTFAHMRELKSRLAQLNRQIEIAQEQDQTKPRWSSFDLSGSM
jgi:ribosome-interacting GTPase 1